MAEQGYLFEVGEEFDLDNIGDGSPCVVVDRAHTHRGNVYWLTLKDEPRFVYTYDEAYLEALRKCEALFR